MPAGACHRAALRADPVAGMTTERHDPSFSRLISPELCIFTTLFEREGAGKAGWPHAPGAPAQRNLRERVNHRYRRIHSGLPCAVVLRLIGTLPGEPLIATVIGAMRKHCRQLDACLGAPGPHHFAVRKPCCSSVSTPTSTATRLACRDDRDTPRRSRRDTRTIRQIRISEKRKIFASWT
jgi:hypothetical protein